MLIRSSLLILFTPDSGRANHGLRNWHARRCLVRRWPFRLLEGLALGWIAGIFLFPFLWMLVTVFKSKPEVLQFPPTWIPQEWRWDNFAAAWNSGPFGRYVLNNVIVAVSILALQLLIGIPAAYVFARFRFKGRGLLFSLVLLALMIPPQVVFLPIYVQMSGWNLINTLLALILPFGASAFGIFLIRQAFMQIRKIDNKRPEIIIPVVNEAEQRKRRHGRLRHRQGHLERGLRQRPELQGRD